MKLEKLLSHPFATIKHELVAKDCMLYALGLGVGSRFESPEELQFCYEDGLRVFPAMVNVIAHPGLWVKDAALDIDWVRLLHVEQQFELHRPLQAGATYVGSYRITDVVDRGTERGALVYLSKELRQEGCSDLSAEVSSVYLLRGDGGCGGTRVDSPPRTPMPSRAPDQAVRQAVLPQAALIYRLSGDYNPIHAAPEIARKAGLPRPILQGLCTLGMVTHAVLQACDEEMPERLQLMGARFTAPVYPGETLDTSLWREGADLRFRTRCLERDAVVLDDGRARWAS